jgi:hypothetical protein
MSKQTDRYLFSVISGGKPHTAMLGYADLLTPLQRALLVQYVRYFAEPPSGSDWRRVYLSRGKADPFPHLFY